MRGRKNIRDLEDEGGGGENIRDLEDEGGRRIFEILKMKGSVTVCDGVSNGL